MIDQLGELPQLGSCEIPEEQLIGITRELVRCMQVFEGHGAPPHAIWPVSYTHLTLPTNREV